MNQIIKTIELDCAPGTTRPSELIADVVKGTSLEHLPEAQPDATISRLFGNWVWEFSNVTDEEWKKAQDIIKPRIKMLYRQKIIRYGSW